MEWGWAQTPQDLGLHRDVTIVYPYAKPNAGESLCHLSEVITSCVAAKLGQGVCNSHVAEGEAYRFRLYCYQPTDLDIEFPKTGYLRRMITD